MTSNRSRAEPPVAVAPELPDWLLDSVRNASDLMIWIDCRGRLFDANESALRAYGWPREEFLRKTIHDLDEDFPPSTWPLHWEHLKRAGSLMITVRHKTASGSMLPLEIVDTYINSGSREFSIAIARDISQRDFSEERMRLMQFSVDRMTDSAFWVGPDASIVYANDAACRNLGYAYDELLKLSIGDIDPVFPMERWPQHWEEMKRKGHHVLETIHRTRDGRDIPVEISVNYVRCNDREFHCAFAHDISERKLNEEKLQHLATHDGLTGLPNRNLLKDRIDQAINAAARNQLQLALLFIDLDQFKLVNDNYGHSVGDALLRHTAALLESVVRNTDTVARQGGDEFVVLLKHLGKADDCERVATAIVDAFREPPQIDGHLLEVTPSIGIAVYPDDGTDGATLAKHADIAMYRAKELGRNQFQFFSEEMGVRVHQRAAMKSGLSRALAGHEFLLHYQPVVALKSRRIVAAEALLRWQPPGERLVPPGCFIPIAEETGLIEQIGAWVIDEVCAQNRRWSDEGIAIVPLAVNVSARQLRHRAVVEVLARALASHRLPAHRLSLELTESMVMEDPQEVVGLLTEVRDLGVTIAIDDFGTGYSSFGYLKRFPIDTIKIDRSFINDISTDPDDAIIVRTIINMAHDLGYRVLAEGIEEHEQLEFLTAHGCDLAQGYHFSRPLPADEFARLLLAQEAAERG